MKNRHIFNELKLDREIANIIFGFFSPADLRKTTLVNKEFSSFSTERKNELVKYFSNKKIYLGPDYIGINADFCTKDIDLYDDSIFNEAAKFYESDSWDPVFKIIGVNRDELVANLNDFIGKDYKVTASPSQGAVFPQISITARRKDEKDFDFKISSLELIQKLLSLGMEVVIEEELEKKLDLQFNNQSRNQLNL